MSKLSLKKLRVLGIEVEINDIKTTVESYWDGVCNLFKTEIIVSALTLAFYICE